MYPPDQLKPQTKRQVYGADATDPTATPDPTATSLPPPAPDGGTGTAPAAGQPTGTVYRDALVKMLGDSQTPASINDPGIKGQADAYSLAQTRATDRTRSAMAERMAQEGGPGTSSGAFDQGLAGLYQQQGESEAGYNAGLVGQANTQKLDQMKSALAMMGNDVNSTEGRDLQRQIAEMQAQIQRDQLTQQGSQFSQSLAEQTRQANADESLKRLGISTQDKLGVGDLMLRLLGLSQSGDQFNQQLGANLGMFGANLNQDALMRILGGL